MRKEAPVSKPVMKNRKRNAAKKIMKLWVVIPNMINMAAMNMPMRDSMVILVPLLILSDNQPPTGRIPAPMNGPKNAP